MKNLLFGFIATILFLFNGNAQTSKEEWAKMMDNFKSLTDKVLENECPKDMDVKEFRSKLFNGEAKLSKEASEKLISISKPIKEYGLEFAKNNKLEYADENELVFFASFSPDVTVNDGGIIEFPDGHTALTTNSIVDCALSALGLDFLYSSAFEGATGWGIKALTKLFGRIATRFLGPVGVIIAVGSFTWCITH